MNEIKLKGLLKKTSQGDEVFLEILKSCGANVAFNEDFVVVSPGKVKLKAFNFNVQNSPDLALPLAVLATMCCGVSKIGGIFRLAFKESNRVVSILSLITNLGGKVKINGGCLEIEGVLQKLEGGYVNCCNDHRVAMAAAICSVCCSKKIVLSGAECVNKSFLKIGGVEIGVCFQQRAQIFCFWRVTRESCRSGY